MEKIKSVLEWKSEKDSKPQFEVLVKINGIITIVTRISDGKSFELNKMYPSLLYDFFKIYCFHEDLQTLEGEYYKDDKMVYTLKCRINDLIQSNGMITDSYSEREKIMAYKA